MKIVNMNGKETGIVELPKQFDEVVRTDIIHKVATIHAANRRQPYGAHTTAGLDVSADLSRRRRHYRGSYGIGISRVPRKIMSRRGTRMNWQGAEVPGTVKGRKAHPPKAEKIWKQKVNEKERKKAIRSALSATILKPMVALNHKVPEAYPFALSKDFESISQAKQLQSSLSTIGLDEELQRCNTRKVRSGRGTMRGRKFKNRTGPLIVVGDEKASIHRAGKNIPGLQVIDVKNLNTIHLTSGTNAGRLTLFTETAIETISKEALFI